MELSASKMSAYTTSARPTDNILRRTEKVNVNLKGRKPKIVLLAFPSIPLPPCNVTNYSRKLITLQNCSACGGRDEIRCCVQKMNPYSPPHNHSLSD